ncbi:MAG TPA: heavy metal sensor histidine kinase [Blastocatellia bacterium]|nr:heavy metal sensor histidine kinase [Blastocatellia bacterium]
MLSIRAKLTLWYLGIAALVLGAFAVAIYFYLSRGLLAAIDTSLWNQAERIALATGHPSSNEEPTQPGSLMLAPQFVSIVDKEGEVTDAILDAEGHEVPLIKSSLEQSAIDDKPRFDEVSISDNEHARIITWPARDEDGEPFFVVVGQSLKDLERAQRQLLILLAVSNPIALLLASLGGLWIANKALRPVDRLTRAAEHIGRGSLSERVEESRSQDEIGRLARTFNEMISKLEQAFERERRFTADASHELKTPLAVLRGDIEVALRRERSAEEYKNVLASSLEEIARLTKLTDDLLTLARSDAGEQVLELEPVRLDTLAAEAHAFIQPLADSSGVALNYDAPASPIVIEGDGKRLKQLLVNLLDNAIKYTPAGGSARLVLRVQDSVALVEISDNGRGIPAESLPHIFERFYRRSDPRDSRVTGFGLGLAISKWIVDAHNGSIEVESEQSRGSRFTVRLPLAEEMMNYEL